MNAGFATIAIAVLADTASYDGFEEFNCFAACEGFVSLAFFAATSGIALSGSAPAGFTSSAVTSLWRLRHLLDGDFRSG